MIREWRKQENQLITLKENKHSFRAHAAKWPQLETEVKNWVRDHRNNGISVSRKMIVCEARRWAAAHDITDFAGTPTWCCSFMKRNGLSMRTCTRMAQKMAVEYESKIDDFHRYVINARKKTQFELGQIGNMDEVPLTSDGPSNRMVDNNYNKNIWP
jgi:hypothetical protein